MADLAQALGEAAVEVRVWKKSVKGQLGLFEDLEVILVEAGMATASSCRLTGVPERACRRHQARCPPWR